MALPRSTFVMGAVVLALFGLAIRETVTTPPAEPPAETRDDTYAAGMAQAEADARDAKAAAEREQFENQRAATRTLYGAEVATLGTLFDGVSLGRDRGATSAVVDANLRAFETRTGSTIRFGPFQGVAIDSITVQLFSSLDSTDRDRLCPLLDRQLHVAWGSSTEEGHAIYTNHVTHQRTVFSTSDEGCTLVFDRYLEPEVWLAALTPLVGQSVETVRTTTGGYLDEQSLIWEIAGLGTGIDGTSVRASIKRRRLSSVEASAVATKQTQTQLIDALVTMYGAPKRTGTERPSVILTWNRPNMHIELETDDADTVKLTARAP
jgi:hypothetical protein